MKSKRVTCTWEFYRDNCEGFKEPMRKELRKLDDYISNIEAENAKLRELVRDMWNGMCGYEHDCRYCEHYELYEGQRIVGECQYHARMRELGVEL